MQGFHLSGQDPPLSPQHCCARLELTGIWFSFPNGPEENKQHPSCFPPRVLFIFCRTFMMTTCTVAFPCEY